MNDRPETAESNEGRSTRQLLAMGAGVAVAAMLLVILPDLWYWAWSKIRLWLPGWLYRVMLDSRWLWGSLAGAALVAVIARVSRRFRWLERAFQRLDELAGQVLEVGLPAGMGGLALLMLATWIPHYLTWPWWADTEHFGLSALSWDRGILPYRDLYDFNFPGPMYVHWFLGRAFGWGKTWPYYVFDLTLLLGFGAVLVAWSWKCLGRPLPGVTAYVVVLGYYLNLDYEVVAQRDWQVPLFALTGLMTLELRRGRLARVLSSLLFGLAFSYRPHTIVFAPAFLLAVDENARESGASLLRQSLPALVEWCVVAGLACVAAFVPLVASGVWDDFLLHFREALSGGGYAEKNRRGFLEILLMEFRRWEISALYLGFLLILAGAWLGRPSRRLALTWLAAAVGVLCYKPLSPVTHGYLNHPIMLVSLTSTAVILGWLAEAPRVPRLTRVLLILGVFAESFPALPAYCRVDCSLRCLRKSLGQDVISNVPPGCERQLSNVTSRPYHWDEYQRLLEYLRTQTAPETRVVNFLRQYPFPTVNAPSGRVSAFPSVAGTLWIRWVDPSLEEEFARAVESARDAVVVWVPGESGLESVMELPRIENVVRTCYAPEAKFGPIEVWRRTP